MQLIYDRYETKDTITIRWTRAFLFYVIALICVVVALTTVNNAWVRILLLGLPLVVQVVTTWQVRQEIFYAEQADAAYYSGTTWNPFMPRVVEIDKRRLP
jgi:hypothetical protein